MKKLPLMVLLFASTLTFASPNNPTSAKKSDNRKPEQFVLFHRDSRNWAVAFRDQAADVIGIEWTVNQEPVTNWTELVTENVVFIDTKKVSAQRYADYFVDQFPPTSIDFKVSSIVNTPDEVVFEWSHKGSGKWPAQREIVHVFRGKDAIYRLAYTVLETAYDENMYAVWLKNIADARLEDYDKWMGSAKKTVPSNTKSPSSETSQAE